MKVIKRILFLLGACTMAALATEHDAGAMVVEVSGFGGRAAWAADQGCFQNVWGGATNSFCSTSPMYVVYPPNLPPAVLGYHSIQVDAYQQNAANPIACNVNLMAKDHSLIATTAQQTGVAGQSTRMTFTFPSTQLTVDSVVGVACTVGPGARVNSVLILDKDLG